MSKLDYYLLEDQAARRRTTFLCLLIGLPLGMLLHAFGLSLSVIAVVCVATAGIVEITRAFTYKLPVKRMQKTSRLGSTRRYIIQGALAASLFSALVSLRRFAKVQRFWIQADLDSAEVLIKVGEVGFADQRLERVNLGLQKLTRTRAPAPDAFFTSTTEILDRIGSSPYKTIDVQPTLVELAEYSSAVVRKPKNVPRAWIGEMTFREGYAYIKDGYFDGDASIANGIERGGLDGLWLENVTFENMTIRYRGGSVILNNVYFINCKFEVPNTSQGSELLMSAIHQPANAKIG